MTEGAQRLAAAVVERTVAAAVAAEVSRATLTRHDAEETFLGGTREEVFRLRQVVAEQALQITTLQNRLEEATREAHRLEMRQLVEAISSAVLDGAASLDGYVVNDARVEVKAALEINGGRLAVTADPGGLVGPDTLSTFEVHLSALPPGLGQSSPWTGVDRVRQALAELQTAVDEADIAATGRAAVLRALSDLISAPVQPAGWLALATALGRLADTETEVADDARNGGLAAHEVGGGRTSATLSAAADALERLAAHLRLLSR